MDTPILIGFAVVVLGFLVLDLFVLNRHAKAVTFRQSLVQTGAWVAVALAFAGFVYWEMGKESAVMFLTGYTIELSLSVDNLFVFLLIFSAFRIKAQYQHRVLFWGIIGALVMRAICIVAGVAALERFEWLMYVFGAILIYGGIKTALDKEGDEEKDPSQGLVARLLRRVVPVTDEFDGERFFTHKKTTAHPVGKLHATPLFLALITVEISDLIFAVDSIPAVLAISRDPFIVYTSNVFAILGLRSIYFALSHLMGLFRYLKYALSVILIFVGVKIAAHELYVIPTEIALGVRGRDPRARHPRVGRDQAEARAFVEPAVSDSLGFIEPCHLIDFWRDAGPRRWFRKDPAFDAVLAAGFAALLEDASGGGLASWEASFEGRFALILVLDQFSRNLYRGDACAFASDAALLPSRSA